MCPWCSLRSGNGMSSVVDTKRVLTGNAHTPQSSFFHFLAVFGKIANNRFSHPSGAGEPFGKSCTAELEVEFLSRV